MIFMVGAGYDMIGVRIRDIVDVAGCCFVGVDVVDVDIVGYVVVTFAGRVASNADVDVHVLLVVSMLSLFVR